MNDGSAIIISSKTAEILIRRVAHAALGPVLGRKGAAFSAEGQAPPGMEKKRETHWVASVCWEEQSRATGDGYNQGEPELWLRVQATAAKTPWQ